MTRVNQPHRPQSRIPEFATRQEAAEWWDAHDLADFQDEFKTVEARFAKNLTDGVAIPLDTATMDRLRSRAAASGIGPVTLARRWIVERLGQDEAPDAVETEASELVAAGTPVTR